ncbi:hypothetical protein [Mucilaginibacter sp.]
MKLKLTTLGLMASAMLIAGCAKDKFTEQDAIQAQKDLLNLQYQHEVDMETLRQKGATALQQLVNTAALAQLRMSDSLSRAGAVAAKKQDYSVTVVDVVSNAPISDADVMISSEGKMVTAKTNAQGIATFSSLYLFPTSVFMVTKTGYAATQILQQNITQNTARLWNTSDLSNEISGTLFIETDLTNNIPENVGEKVLVTATASINSSSTSGTYTVSFPTYTTATGTYAIKVPAAPNGYTLTFDQITADQKLYVNAIEGDAATNFPGATPRSTTLQTTFNVNKFNATVPNVNNSFYFKFDADRNGKVLTIPANSYYNNSNQFLASAVNGKYQLERVSIGSYFYNSSGNYVDYSSYTYPANSKVNVQMVDVTGTIIQTAPLLEATTGSSGQLTSVYTTDNTNTFFNNYYSYVSFKRDNAGNIVSNAKGVILKTSSLYDSSYSLYNLTFTNNLNTSTGTYINNSYLLPNKGDKKIVNFYYGAGESRVKQVY